MLTDNRRILPHLGASLKAIWTHRKELSRLAALPVLLSCTIIIIKLLLLDGDGDLFTFQQLIQGAQITSYFSIENVREKGIFSIMVYAGAAFIFTTYIMSAVVVLAYRFFLRKERPISLFSGYFDTLKPLGVGVWSCLVFFLLIGAISPVIIGIYRLQYLTNWQMVDFIDIVFIISILVSIFLFYILLRLMFVTLYVSIGSGFSCFRKSWVETKRHYWGLFLVLFSFFLMEIIRSIIGYSISYIFGFFDYFLSGEFAYALYGFSIILDLAKNFIIWFWGISFVARIWEIWNK